MDESFEKEGSQVYAEQIATYRYPGFHPFQDTHIDRQLFFGREKEQDLLFHKILAERLVVLYAKSGMGKTSLLNAGVFESLRSRQYIPLVVRLHDSDNQLWDVFYQRIADQADKYKSDGFVSDWYHGVKNTLWEYFKTAEFWSSQDELLRPVLILDQFEELFTRVTDHDARNLFVKQLSDLIRGRMPLVVRDQLSKQDGLGGKNPGYTDSPPEVKTIISIREAHYGHLQALAKKIPEIYDSRFRLEPLSRDKAREAIVEPARQQIGDKDFDKTGFTYSEAAVTQILDFLCRKKNEVDVTAQTVEPFQLQQLCGKLEDKARASANRRIEAEDLGGERGMNRILQDFYDDEMDDLPNKNHRSNVQNLIENGLISRKSKIRIPLHGEDIKQRFGVSDETLDHLIHRRLLRSERKEDGYLFELSHDTLIKPILNSRDKRLALLKKKQEKLEKREKRLKEKKIKQEKIKIRLKAIIGALILVTLPAVVLFYLLYDLPRQYFSVGVMEKDAWKKIQTLSKAVNSPIDFPNAQLELAKAYLSVGKSRQAIQHLKEAIRQKPDYHEAHFILANAYVDEGNYDLALIYYENTTIMDRNNCLAYYALGSLQLSLGKTASGFENLQRTIDCGPQNVDYYFRIADIFRSQNRFDDVVEIYQKGIKNNPDEGRLYLFLANELFDRREYEKAAIRYEQSIAKAKSFSSTPNLLQNLAFCYYRTERYTEAVQHYDKAAQLIHNDFKSNPDQKRQALAQIYFLRGQVFLKRELYAQAIEDFKMAINNYPFMVSAYEKISDAYRNNLQPELADEYKDKEKVLRSF